MKNLSAFLFLQFVLGISFMSFGNEDKKENLAPTALVTASSFVEKEEVKNETVESVKTSTVVKNQLDKVAKKEVMEKIKELKEEVNYIKNASEAQKKSADWDPKFKIGAILTAVAILLAIVGIGWVAGLAAIVGLFFIIVGLLHTYN